MTLALSIAEIRQVALKEQCPYDLIAIHYWADCPCSIIAPFVFEGSDDIGESRLFFVAPIDREYSLFVLA